MNDISIDRVYVKGYEYLHIIELQIWQKICEHGRSRITAIADKAIVEKNYNHINEKDIIQIYGNDKVLFSGIVNKATIRYEDEVAFFEVELDSTTRLLDSMLESRSYQHTTYTYADVITKSLSGKGMVFFHAANQTVPGLVIQYRETAWQFVMRMALKCNAPIFAEVSSDKPKICVGYNDRVIDDFIYAGNMIDNKYVTEVYTELVRGVLHTTYVLSGRNDVMHYIGKVCPPALYAGKIMKGVVKGVDSDRIQAHLIEIDSEYDASGDCFFPYSTTYSSANGPAGFYVMPIEEDSVRIFFPSEKSEEAFAASSSCARGSMVNEKEKCFQTPNGMGIYFTEKGINIVCGSEHVSINLDKKDGISFISNGNISFISKDKIEIEEGVEEINISSDKEVYIGTDASFVRISAESAEKIDMFANKIFVC